MIEETARIVALDADAVWIEARRESACGRCAARSGCGHGLLDRLRSGRSVHLRLHLPREAGTAPLAVGDLVQLGISERAVLSGSLRLYALPLAGLLLGSLAGDALGAGDAIAALGGVTGLAAGLAAVFALDRVHPVEMPRILRRVAGPVAAGISGEDEPRPISVV